MVAVCEVEMETAAKKKFDRLAEKLGIPKEKCLIPSGQAEPMILEAAKRLKADLIVVGSHGRHGLSLMLLGSTANSVLHNAPCDVLAVRVEGIKEKVKA